MCIRDRFGNDRDAYACNRLSQEIDKPRISFTVSESTKKKISNTLRGYKHKDTSNYGSGKVRIKWDGKEYSSISEASRETGTSINMLWRKAQRLNQ